MNKILLPILSTIFSLTTVFPGETVSAETPSDRFSTVTVSQTKSNTSFQNSHRLTKQKWQRLATRYYQSRFRRKFEPDNSLLSLREVNHILGFAGKRNRIDQQSSHQYWYWQDDLDPRKKIEGVFVYHQLVSLKTRGFDRQELQLIKARILRQNHQS